MRRQLWYPAKEGDKRIVTFFAWWPITIGTDWRWLEVVTVEYLAISCDMQWLPGGPNFQLVWKPKSFIEYYEKD